MRDSVLGLARKGVPDDEIAAMLTATGHRSPKCEDKMLPTTVRRIRYAAGVRQSGPRKRWAHEPTLLSPPELADRLKIPVNWLYVQIRQKRLLIDRQTSGGILFPDTAAVFEAILGLRTHTISSLDLRICQPHQEGH